MIIVTSLIPKMDFPIYIFLNLGIRDWDLDLDWACRYSSTKVYCINSVLLMLVLLSQMWRWQVRTPQQGGGAGSGSPGSGSRGTLRQSRPTGQI